MEKVPNPKNVKRKNNDSWYPPSIQSKILQCSAQLLWKLTSNISINSSIQEDCFRYKLTFWPWL